MRFYKTKLLILFMIVAAGFTFYYFGDPQKLVDTTLETIKRTPLQSLVERGEKINTDNLDSSFKNTIQSAQAEISTLGDRTKEVQKHTSNILGSSIEAADENTPIHEKAFEYGRYVYCKSVVTDYEVQNNKLVE